jgi:hypothetical protein
VLADIGDALRKNSLGQAGHRQQEMIPQAIAAFRCVYGMFSGHQWTRLFIPNICLRTGVCEHMFSQMSLQNIAVKKQS